MMLIKLTYFKDIGKFYTEDSFTADFKSFESIVKHVDEMHHRAQLPGLVEGAGKEFFVLIEPPDGDGAHGVPHLLSPIKDLHCGTCGSRGAEERYVNGVSVGVLCKKCWYDTIYEAHDSMHTRQG